MSSCRIQGYTNVHDFLNQTIVRQQILIRHIIKQIPQLLQSPKGAKYIIYFFVLFYVFVFYGHITMNVVLVKTRIK